MLGRYLSQTRIDGHENGNVEAEETSSTSSNNQNKRKNSETDDDIITSASSDITNGDDESTHTVDSDRTNESSISSQNRPKKICSRRSDTYGEFHPPFEFYIFILLLNFSNVYISEILFPSSYFYLSFHILSIFRVICGQNKSGNSRRYGSNSIEN